MVEAFYNVPDVDPAIKQLEEFIAGLEKELNAIRLQSQRIKKRGRKRPNTFEVWAKKQRTRAWILVGVSISFIGLASLVSILVIGSYFGFYIDFLRPFWVRLAPGGWDDLLKIFIFWAITAFAIDRLKYALEVDSL